MLRAVTRLATRRSPGFPSSGSTMAAVDVKRAVLQHQEGDEKLTLSFTLQLPDSGETKPPTKRVFSLNRPVTETVEKFLQRLDTNVDKFVKKAKKKKKKRGEGEGDGDGVESAGPHSQFFRQDGSPINSLDRPIGDLVLGECGVRLQVLGQNFALDLNPPIVEALKLPSQAMANFLVFPKKLNVRYGDREKSKLEWFVGEEVDGDQWTKRSEGKFFVPTTEDIDKALKLTCTPRNDSGEQEGASRSVVAQSRVSAGPGVCPFEQRHAFTREVTPPSELRVVTYNLLADLYADSDFSRTVLHPNCPQYALDLDYRKQLIAKELLGYNADVVCLQEVDEKLFTNDLEVVLGPLGGLQGAFCRKGGQVSEGLACFWRQETFDIVESHRFVLSDVLQCEEAFGDVMACLEGNEELKENVLRRTTVLQIVVLESKTDPKVGYVIGNTHLYFKPDADHIRLLQIGLCMRKLDEIVKKWSQSFNGRKYSLVMCGDFNSTPPFGVLEYMTTGYIDEQHADWSSCEGQKVTGLKLSHRYRMESACGTPQYTNYTKGFADCLDYIFYQTDNLTVSQVVPFPSEAELKQHGAIPSVVFPSDHIACVCDLKTIS